MAEIFKFGTAKQIDKNKISDEFVKTVISRNSRHTEKLFKDIDCYAIMKELYEYYKATITEDYSVKEIADIMGIKESTVKAQLHRGRILLRSMLKEKWENE
jgi:RNA polymerase sigma-70 factor (ECF subfamily)